MVQKRDVAEEQSPNLTRHLTSLPAMVAAVLLALATYAGIASAWKVHDNAPFGNGGNPPGYAVAASVESSPSATGPSTTPSTAANSSSALNFGPINFAGYNNYVYRDDITAAQIVVSE